MNAIAATEPNRKTRIVVLGGGFGGFYTAYHLERLCRRRADVEITLVSRDNFVLLTPLLFEVCTGILDLRHCAFPIRAFHRRTRFQEGIVQSVDVDRRIAHVDLFGRVHDIEYDILVLALGAITNQQMIPGSEHATTMKNLADGLLLRNHMIEQFERADAETDPELKRKALTFAVIGGGLVGVELFGEITAFADEIVLYYPHVRRDEVRFVLLQAVDRLMPEIDETLAKYAHDVLSKRVGADVRVKAPVQRIEPGKIHVNNEVIEAETIVLAAGILPNPIVAALPVERAKRGQIMVHGTMQSKSHSEIWALGDCAFIPAPDGTPYPNLAQHALRQAKLLASNIVAAIDGGEPKPFVYQTMGMMGSLGHYRGFGTLMGIRTYGFIAWFVRRTYYLLQMPGWRRRLRIMTDWTFALLFRPDITRINLKGERATTKIEERP